MTIQKIKISPAVIYFIFAAILIATLAIALSMEMKKPNVETTYTGLNDEKAILEITSLLTAIENQLNDISNKLDGSLDGINESASQLLVLNHAFLNWAEQQGLIAKVGS